MRRGALPLLLALAPALPGSLRAQGAVPDSAVYLLSPASRLEVTTGKAGLLGFAGHEHVIRARGFSGRLVYYAAEPAASRVEIRVATDSLEVLTPPDTAEIRKVTVAMRTQVLEVDRFPEITFISRQVTPIQGGYRMRAELTMHGVSRTVPVEVQVSFSGDTLRATSSFAVNQTDFGITPFRGGPGGTVRVADRVTFRIAAVAVR